ncbi:MAG: FGGY-family carbohydrate kinase [bacterium]
MRNKNKSPEFVIGLDSSTTATKAIAFDKAGKIMASASAPIPLYSPQSYYYEQDPNDWWISAKKVLNKITDKIDPERIRALSISNQRETFVPLNAAGKQLRPAIIWLDERCKDEVLPFSQKVGEKNLHRITGKPVDHAPVVYRLAWMRHQEPDLFSQIAMVCDVHTFLTWKLTGLFTTSWASADPLGLFDCKNKHWSPVILNALELTDSQFPQTVSPGTVIGKISREASQITNLNMGTSIIAGGGDGQMAGLGSQAYGPERAYLNLGTAVVAGVYSPTYRTSQAFRTLIACWEQGYIYECSLRAGTFALDWFIKQILNIDPGKQKNIYQTLQTEAEQVPAGSDNLFFLPYICGVMNPYWNSEARGAFVGLASHHHRGHLYRAVLEGIAFEQRLALNRVEQETGQKISMLISMGGGTKNTFWCQMIANITGRTIGLPAASEASALGAGIAAAVGIEWYPTFQAAAEKMTSLKKMIHPHKKTHKIYKKLFKHYQKLYPALNNL